MTQEDPNKPVSIPFITYDATGRILSYGMIPESMLDLQGDPANGIFVMAGMGNFVTDWVVNGVITPRPPNPVQLNGMILTNIPIPSTIMIDNQSYPCDVDTIELTLPFPGKYTVQVLSFPELDVSYQVIKT